VGEVLWIYAPIFAEAALRGAPADSMLMRSVRASVMHPPGRLASADLFGQSDNDACGAAEITEPAGALVLRDLAEEFGAVGAQAGDGNRVGLLADPVKNAVLLILGPTAGN
jgi:hypothetical protein